MGHIKKPAKLHLGAKSLDVEALIDTGSTTLILPKSIVEKLDAQVLGKLKAELADGTTKEFDYCVVELELLGRRAPTIASITDKGEVCVGVEVLERLGLAVNPVTSDVYPVRKFVTRL